MGFNNTNGPKILQRSERKCNDYELNTKSFPNIEVALGC
jgi:hypothetical protein